MDDQQVAHFRPSGHRQVDACEIVLHRRVAFPPGGLVADAGRVVALRLALHGVPEEVLAAQVDAAGDLPVAQRLVAGEGEVPARAAVGFGEPPLATKLPRGGRHLLGGVEDAPVLGEQVHARRLHVFVEAHRGADHVRLPDERVFLQYVAGEEQVVVLAPLADLTREGVHEEVGDAIMVMVARRGHRLAVHVVDQFHEMGQQIVTVALFKDPGQLAGPRQAAAFKGVVIGAQLVAVVRLVSENAGHGAAELLANPAQVVFMGRLDKGPHRLVAEGVEVRVAVVPGAAALHLHAEAQDHLAVLQFLRRRSLRDGRHVARLAALHGGGEGGQRVVVPRQFLRFLQYIQHQLTRAVLLMFCDQPARGAGGPAVLVIQPCFHAELLRFINAGVHAGEPVVGKIGGIQPHAGVHEEATQAGAVHGANLPAQFLRLQLAIPRPEGLAAIRRAGRGEFPQNGQGHDDTSEG
ncbi:MAG: hypothetical protein BWY76_03070 [bacterium ADurb.Bin429]|nr:MAG: hypothetical protein BWY76_03070 [bacterium ADurb.Bin429]